MVVGFVCSISFVRHSVATSCGEWGIGAFFFFVVSVGLSMWVLDSIKR
jgi:hypothetical protein